MVVSDRTRGDEPWLLLSGDALFVGDSGRPDLAVAGDEGASALYRSLHERLGTLDDGVELFPGHVAGSLCGRGMSSKTSSTLGFERRFNPMLAEMTVDDFVQKANADLAPKPPTMARIVELNRGPLLGELPRPRTVPLPAADAQVLDVRDGEHFAERPHGGLVQRLGRGHGIRQPLRLRARPRARGRARGREPRAGCGRRAQARRRRLHAARRGGLRHRRRRTRTSASSRSAWSRWDSSPMRARSRSSTCARPPSRPRWRPARCRCPTGCSPRPISPRSIPSARPRSCATPARARRSARRCWRAADSRTCAPCSARA